MSFASQQSSTNQNQQTSPWGPQADWLTNAFKMAGGALSQANANAGGITYGSPTQFTANITPEQMATFRTMAGYQNNSPDIMNTAGGQLLRAGVLGSTNFDPSGGANPWATAAGAQTIAGAQSPAIQDAVKQAMLSGTQEARDVINPGIDASAAGSGNINNSRTDLAHGLVDRGLAEQASSLAGSLSSGIYSNALNTVAGQENANNALRLQNNQNNTGLGLGALSGGVQTAGDIFGIQGAGGAGLYAGAQNPLTNQLQAWQFGQQSPFEALNRAFNIWGSNNWGSNSSGTSTTTTTPSMMQMLSSLMGGAGSAMNGLGMMKFAGMF